MGSLQASIHHDGHDHVNLLQILAHVPCRASLLKEVIPLFVHDNEDSNLNHARLPPDSRNAI